MHWVNDNELELDGVRFLVTIDPSQMMTAQSGDGTFVLAKTRSMVEEIRAIGEHIAAKRVFEIGIFKGGSTALYDKLFQPTRLVAIDLSTEPMAALGEYLAANGREGAVEPLYGVNQADTGRLREILDVRFPGRSLDLVVDDASHFYDETKASFNAAFPCLRDGGVYVIEDWAWAHWPGDLWQKDGGIWRDRPALSNLAVEIVMTCASASHLVRSVRALPAMLIVERGHAPLPAGFDISRAYLTRGRDFQLQL